ncbi:hypothetical protein D3C73_1593270 [compost metagenome]
MGDYFSRDVSTAVQAAYEKTSVRAATGQLSNIYSVLVMFERKPCISRAFFLLELN